MYGKSQKSDCFLSDRDIRSIQRYRKTNLLRLIYCSIKCYQCFDIQLSGMDQPDGKILNLPLQAQFISIYNVFLSGSVFPQTAILP